MAHDGGRADSVAEVVYFGAVRRSESHRRSEDGLLGLRPIHSLTYSVWPAWPWARPISAAFCSHTSNDATVACDTVRFFAAAAGNANPTASIAVIASVAIRMIPSRFQRSNKRVGIIAPQAPYVKISCPVSYVYRCCNIATRATLGPARAASGSKSAIPPASRCSGSGARFGSGVGLAINYRLKPHWSAVPPIAVVPRRSRTHSG
jgi:hypothetical protein